MNKQSAIRILGPPPAARSPLSKHQKLGGTACCKWFCSLQHQGGRMSVQGVPLEFITDSSTLRGFQSNAWAARLGVVFQVSAALTPLLFPKAFLASIADPSGQGCQASGKHHIPGTNFSDVFAVSSGKTHQLPCFLSAYHGWVISQDYFILLLMVYLLQC